MKIKSIYLMKMFLNFQNQTGSRQLFTSTEIIKSTFDNKNL